MINLDWKKIGRRKRTVEVEAAEIELPIRIDPVKG